MQKYWYECNYYASIAVLLQSCYNLVICCWTLVCSLDGWRSSPKQVPQPVNIILVDVLSSSHVDLESPSKRLLQKEVTINLNKLLTGCLIFELRK